MARAINTCPDCGATVSQFAAGCAVCGFDLEAARGEAAARGPSLSDRLAAARPGWLRSPTVQQDFLVVALTIARSSSFR